MKTLICKSTGKYLRYEGGKFISLEVPQLWHDNMSLDRFRKTAKDFWDNNLDISDVELIEVFVIKKSDLPKKLVFRFNFLGNRYKFRNWIFARI